MILKTSPVPHPTSSTLENCREDNAFIRYLLLADFVKPFPIRQIMNIFLPFSNVLFPKYFLNFACTSGSVLFIASSMVACISAISSDTGTPLAFRTGKYGAGNKQLMEKLKNYLKNNDLFKDDTTVLGIALDNPSSTPENEQRYDVGMVITGKDIRCDLPIRNIDSRKQEENLNFHLFCNCVNIFFWRRRSVSKIFFEFCLYLWVCTVHSFVNNEYISTFQ